MNTADLMYVPRSSENRELATVKFSVATQEEIWMRSADGLV